MPPRTEAETFLKLWDDAIQRGMLGLASMYGDTAVRLGILTQVAMTRKALDDYRDFKI